jgi:hypothetical protein
VVANLTPEELADLVAYLQSLTSGDSEGMRDEGRGMKAEPRDPHPSSLIPHPFKAAPVQLTAQEDHKRTMELLGIRSLRKGADPRNPKAENAVNYDEAKANPYPDLPDPLVLKDGKKVTTGEMWFKQRRPEIVEDFDREIYGRVPRDTPKVKWEVADTKKQKVGETEVVAKQLVGHVDNSACPQIGVDIKLTLTTPADAKGPVPVILEFGFGFGGRFGADWQQQVLSRGWGFAILTPTSVQADNGAGLTKGIIGLCNKGQPRKVDDWGRCEPGRGGPAAPSITSRPTRRWTPRRWASRDFLATGRRRWSPWPMTSGSPSASLARPGREASSSTAATSANRWRTSRASASTTGWPATTSSTPAR